jgi:hypothetical protein
MERCYYSGSEKNRTMRVVWIHVDFYDVEETHICTSVTVVCVLFKAGYSLI